VTSIGPEVNNFNAATTGAGLPGAVMSLTLLFWGLKRLLL